MYILYMDAMGMVTNYLLNGVILQVYGFLLVGYAG